MPNTCARDTGTLNLYPSTTPPLETLNCPHKRPPRPTTGQLRAAVHVVVGPRGIELWPAFVPLTPTHLAGGLR